MPVLLNPISFLVAQEDGITLLDLVTHRSGLPRMPDNFNPADPANPQPELAKGKAMEKILRK
jgi:serine-type D-Ala-D-Ala carboxypeptidase/endopeptidase